MKIKLLFFVILIPSVYLMGQQINNKGEKLIESINVSFYSEGELYKPNCFKLDFRYNSKNELARITKSYEYNSSPYQDGFNLKKGLEIYNIYYQEGLIDSINYIAFSNGKQLPIKKKYKINNEGLITHLLIEEIGISIQEYKFYFENNHLNRFEEIVSYMKDSDKYLNHYYVTTLEWDSNLKKYICDMDPYREYESRISENNEFEYSNIPQNINININNLLVIGKLNTLEEITFGWLGNKSLYFISNSIKYKKSPFSQLDNEFEYDKARNVSKIIQKKKEGEIFIFQTFDITYKY